MVDNKLHQTLTLTIHSIVALEMRSKIYGISRLDHVHMYFVGCYDYNTHMYPQRDMSFYIGVPLSF
jgi:hypothetical protein